jgi:hypothetical protein
MIKLDVNLGNTPKIANGCHIMSGNVKTYIRDGFKHRDNGPAEIYPNGKSIWFKMGKKHRDNGPAVEYPNSPELNEYWLEGNRVKKF